MTDVDDARRARGSRGGILWHLLVAVVTAVLASLGFWQLDRHAQLQERNALVEARLAAEPRPYAELVAETDPDAATGTADDASLRPVVVEGRFDAEHEVLLRGRSYEDQPGYHVLTPLRIAEDRAVLVDRGWVPYRVEGPGGPAFAPPEGPVRVVGRLMPEADPPEGFLAGLAPRDPPTGELDAVARADVDRLQAQVPYALDPYLVEVASLAPADASSPEAEASETDAPSDDEAALPVVPPAPGPEPGPHVGYAIQWFAFALIAAVGYTILVRQRG